MRATLSTTYRSMLSNLNKNSTRLSDLQVMGATGKRMTKPSDDPSGIRPVVNARGQIRSSERFLQTMGTAMDRFDTTDTQLSELRNLMIRAKELLVGAGNLAMSDQDLRIFGQQARLLKDEMVAIGNTQINGKYVFAGFAEGTVPFDGTPGVYNGDDGAIEFEIGPGEKVAVNLTGNNLFLGDFNFDGATDPGGVDLFQVFDNIIAALDPAFPGTPNPNAALAEMNNLDRGADQVSRFRSGMGNLGARIENSMIGMEDASIEMQKVLSRYEDADIVKVLSDMTQQETAFKAALEITARVSKLTILDYVR